MKAATILAFVATAAVALGDSSSSSAPHNRLRSAQPQHAQNALQEAPRSGPGAKRAQKTARASEPAAPAAPQHPTQAEDPAKIVARAAASGNVGPILRFAKGGPTGKRAHLLRDRDSEGWTPVQRAARAGHLDAVQFFVYYGADLHEEVEGKDCLGLVKEHHGEDHPLYQYLVRQAARKP